MQWWVLQKRIHISWLIAVFCVGVSVGVIALSHIPLSSPIWLVTGVVLAIIGFWRGRLYAILFISIAGLLVGIWRGSSTQLQLSVYANIQGKEVSVKGIVRDDPERDKTNATVVKLAVQTINDHAVEGSVRATLSSAASIKRGDVVAVKGVIQDGFGSTAATMYRAELRSIERPIQGDVAGQVRDWFSHRVQEVIAPPQSLLGIGFLTGQSQALPKDLEEAMRAAGLTHIVVASGYNLTILVRLARRIFAKISKYLVALSGATMIGGFIAVTGWSPSMTRAGLVAGLSLAAWYYGRKFHPIVLLAFVAAVTLLINPSYGWGDLGWQLSFAAFAGVMIIAPLAQAYFFGDNPPGILRQIVGETIAAQAATLPILIAAFGQFSAVALFANVAVVPLVPLVMLLVFITGVMSSVSWAGVTFGYVSSAFLTYMIEVTRFFASLPWAVIELQVPWYVPLLGYSGIIAATLWMWWATRFDLRSSSVVD